MHDTPEPLHGDVLGGRYRLIEPLRPDGDGQVFRARDDLLARDVAVKIFHADPSTTSSDAPRRLAGARALAGLDHPSLITLYDAHISRRGHGYLIMELIGGPTLRQYLDDRGPLTASHALEVVRGIADGLAALHHAGIVHHHVTSSNVLLRPPRHTDAPFAAVLAGFTVTHLVGENTHPDTPDAETDAEYLPPEQLRGESPQAASDIYALGLLAQEVLTGERPLTGGAVQELVLAPLDYDPEIPTGFGYGWEVLLTAMTDPDPRARPTAAEVVDLVTELDEDRAPAPPPPSPPASVDMVDPAEDAAPVTALRAVNQSRETATTRYRRRAVWAWVTHYR